MSAVAIEWALNGVVPAAAAAGTLRVLGVGMNELIRTGMLGLVLAITGCTADKGQASATDSDADPSSSGGATESGGPTTGSSGATEGGGATESGGATETAATESGGVTATEPAEETETGETETEGEPAHVNLFTCGVVQACESIVLHIDPEPPAALECAAKLVLSGEAGLIRALETLGGNLDETEQFVLLLGDGKALLQSRSRRCSFDDDDCDEKTVPWEPSSPHSICDVVVPEDLAAACGCGMDDCPGCSWMPWGQLENCVGVEDWTCEAALAVGA